MPEQSIRDALDHAGIHKVDIRPIGPSLEDVFVALTRQHEGGSA